MHTRGEQADSTWKGPRSALPVVVLQSGDQTSPPGATVTLECRMGEGIDMSSYTMLWYRQNHHRAQVEFLIKEHEKTVGRFHSSIEATKNSFSLQITELFVNDSSTYYCATVTVMQPDQALIQITGLYISLTVSVKEHKDSLQLSALKLQQFFMQLFISVNNFEPAYFGRGTKLTVLESGRDPTPPTVKVLPPSQKECRNKKDRKRKKTLVCVATGFYPDHVKVSWTINGVGKPEGVATDSAAVREGQFYRITSRLRVPADEWFKPDNKFTCNVKFFDGTTSTDHAESINGETDVSGGGMSREKYLRITQSAKLSYGVFIVKSCIYGAFVSFLVWKLQSSAGKQKK
ncbi:M1-specific T cell receptor beta chain-like [Leuresthes tenuis]|uniref:M1-specific T cell receptor beta chain-like n=1 Tax=Leuresthes tenuis TaxID=355514 RepID=UPI003B5045B2